MVAHEDDTRTSFRVFLAIMTLWRSCSNVAIVSWSTVLCAAEPAMVDLSCLPNSNSCLKQPACAL